MRRHRQLRSIIVVGIAGCLISGQAAAEVRVGAQAPEFTLQDAKGRTRSLSDFKGSVVVLEWLNPDCPFVRKHYDSGNMQRLQREARAQKAVWLSVNSSAPGRQGHLTPETAAEFRKARDARPKAILLDPDGVVGRQYGAKTTPHMFLIDREGVLVYAGAIDDRSSTDPADIPGATNYVDAALSAVAEGRAVSTASTKPYGCSIKYAGPEGSWFKNLFE